MNFGLIAMPVSLFARSVDSVAKPVHLIALLGNQAALEHIDQQSGKLFDPAVVKAFLQVVRER